jgi:hypothetical protein
MDYPKTNAQLGLQFHEKKHGCHDFPIDGDYYHGHDPTAPRTFSSLKIGI